MQPWRSRPSRKAWATKGLRPSWSASQAAAGTSASRSWMRMSAMEFLCVAGHGRPGGPVGGDPWERLQPELLVPAGSFGKSSRLKLLPRGKEGMGRLLALVQEPLRVQRGHAAKAGRGDRLAVVLVGDVAGGEHALDRGFGGAAAQARTDLQVAVVHRQLALEQRG